jgi:uncharacterized protein YneR
MRRIDKLKNIRTANILAEMRYFENKGMVLESKKSEEQGLKILQSKGIEDSEEVIKTMAEGDKSNNQKNIPIMAFLYDGKIDLANIIETMNEYNALEVKKRISPIILTKTSIKIDDNEFTNFIKFSEFIHSETGKYSENKTVKSNVASDFIPEKKPMWSGNGIDIYEGNNVLKCIAYSKEGGLTNRPGGYSFCIGRQVPSSNLYKSYRDIQVSSFYFIVDRNHFKENEDGTVDLNDPLHMVVFDMTKDGIKLTDANNKTGTIAKYGEDVDAYVNYLKSMGVPVDKLVNRPKTPQEIYEDKLFSKRNTNLEWFINLDNPRNSNYKKPVLEPGQVEQNYYKSAYIGRGFILSDEQFDFLNGR